MKSKIIILKSGRKIKRYEDKCPTCNSFKGWKDRNALGRECHSCANIKINKAKIGKTFKSNKYKHISNVNINDFIKVRNVTKYKVYCRKCNNDRGYQRPNVFDKLCNICSSVSKTKQDCIALGKSGGFVFLDNDYITYKHKHNWKCNNCNFTFKRSLNDMSKRQNCPYCNRFSNENEVRKIFEAKFNKSFPNVRPNFLKNPQTNFNLELDGYCEELKLAFEYDGEFHYKDMDWIDDRNRLEKVKQRDKLKDVLCKENDIILIRIPYWKNKDLKSYINQQLKDIGVADAESGK